MLEIARIQIWRSKMSGITISYTAQSAGVVEYTDCTSAEKKRLHNECSGYEIKSSDVQTQALVIWRMWSIVIWLRNDFFYINPFSFIIFYHSIW